jgi:hypothetical protein
MARANLRVSSNVAVADQQDTQPQMACQHTPPLSDLLVILQATAVSFQRVFVDLLLARRTINSSEDHVSCKTCFVTARGHLASQLFVT